MNKLFSQTAVSYYRRIVTCITIVFALPILESMSFTQNITPLFVESAHAQAACGAGVQFPTTASRFTDAIDQVEFIAFGDVDSDGDLDIAVGVKDAPNKIYENNDGILIRQHIWASNDEDDTRSVAWGDVDNDGDLDLAVGNEKGANKLYLNNEGLLSQDTDWSSNDADETHSISWADVDRDGDLDLAVGNHDGPNKLYLNQNGLLDVEPYWLSSDDDDTNGLVWADVDQDGFFRPSRSQRWAA